MIDKYIYALTGAPFLLLSVLCCGLRRDLRKMAIKGGVLGGLTALATAPIYLYDYWRPPNIFNTHPFSVEDFMFGCGLTAFIIVLYPVLSRKQLAKTATPKKLGPTLLFVSTPLLVIAAGMVTLHLNSVVLTNIALVGMAVFVWLRHRDLIVPSLLTAAVVTLIVLVLYVIEFDFLAPQWGQRYWLLTDTPYAVYILGHVPVLDVSWYTCWALLASTIYPFLRGARFGNNLPPQPIVHEK